MKHTFYIFLLFGCTISAQIKGIVKDSLSGQPIPYVNIWVENENTGSTSEENGTFIISTLAKNRKLIFSTLGYEKKIIAASESNLVLLNPVSYHLDEVVISKSIGTRTLEIGKTNSEIYQAFDNGPKIDTKFFPYISSYKKTRYLKKVAVYTDSRIERALIKIHFYAVAADGYPAEELLDKDLIVTVKKGTGTNWFDLSGYNLIMPKNGLFVGFEKLLIENNKIEKIVTDLSTNTNQIQKTYYPFLLYNYVERNSSYTFSGGQWNKVENGNQTKSDKMMINEPAINLILTN